MPYFATTFVRTGSTWQGHEVELDDAQDLDQVADLLRDDLDGADGPAVLLVEENDEYFAIVRLDNLEADPRTFISDVRSVETSELAAILYDEVAGEFTDDEDDAEGGEDLDEETGDEEAEELAGEPGGDDTILRDLGTSALQLRELCAEEGMLPADALYTICERAGCVEQLEELRDA